MYSLLTGLYPLYQIKDVKVFQKRLQEGEVPHIDPRYHDRSLAESKLADIIPLCFEFDPDKRIDIFHLVVKLRQAYDEVLRIEADRAKKDTAI